MTSPSCESRPVRDTLVLSNLEAVVEALGFGLHLLGVLQHPLVQHQGLAPLLHQHVGLSYEETPGEGVESHNLIFYEIIYEKPVATMSHL